MGARLAEVSRVEVWVTVAYDLAAQRGRKTDRAGATRRDAVRRAAMACLANRNGDAADSCTK